MQRAVTWTLLTILVVLQGQLWIGRGSLPEVWRLQSQLSQQAQLNGKALITNQRSWISKTAWRWWKNAPEKKSAWSAPMKYLCSWASKAPQLTRG